ARSDSSIDKHDPDDGDHKQRSPTNHAVQQLRVVLRDLEELISGYRTGSDPAASQDLFEQLKTAETETSQSPIPLVFRPRSKLASVLFHRATRSRRFQICLAREHRPPKLGRKP